MARPKRPALVKKTLKAGVQSIGQKRPFTRDDLQLIRAALKARTKDDDPQVVRNAVREIALLEVALSTCLRSSDLLKLTVDDVTFGPTVMRTMNVQMRKTSRVLNVSINDKAAAALTAWIALLREESPGYHDRLWTFRREHYGDIVKTWAGYAQLDPKHYSTHSLRRSTPSHIYDKTKNAAACAKLLGHTALAHTMAYLGVGTKEAQELKEQHEL